jgi:two-component system, OmpR family, sensor histidine kinase VicK
MTGNDTEPISSEEIMKEKHEFFEVISDPNKGEQILLDLAKHISKEAIYLLPADKALVRLEKIGLVDHLIEASQKRKAQIKIMSPLSDTNFDIIRRISDNAPDIQIIAAMNTSSAIFIVDNSKLLRTEVIDPNADEFSKAVGFILYSNSKPSINSFKMFFELLWNVCVENQELIRIDRMKDDFINVAAHEFKTPIQSILGYLELAMTSSSYNTIDKQITSCIDAAYRNATRLQRLTRNMLEVTRIESNTLKLDKEQFDLREKITNVVNDITTSQIENDNNNKHNIEISFSEPNTPIIVKADRLRIYEVISNLLTNATKFTKNNDKITIATHIVQNEKNHESNSNNENTGRHVIIRVKDRGVGIDSEIEKKLFAKFATKSYGGTGLGLYISKGIIKAHGGKIWAENNTDGKGATFSFSLPLNN